MLLHMYSNDLSFLIRVVSYLLLILLDGKSIFPCQHFFNFII